MKKTTINLQENSKSYHKGNNEIVTRVEVELDMDYIFKNKIDITKEIELLAETGMPDVEIAKKLNCKYSYVNIRTTKYWKRKMKERECESRH